MSIYDFEVKSIDGEPVSLLDFEGCVLLIVNVASQCGFTPQLHGLQKLWETYRDDGLVVLGFPSRDFPEQEPGTNEDIKEFVESKYGIDFPMFSKVSVTGPAPHPLFNYLTDQTGTPITRNFHKFLVDRDGTVVDHYGTQVEPRSETLVSALEDELAIAASDTREP